MPYRHILFALVLTAFTDSLAEEFLQPLIVVRLELQGISSFLIGLASSSGDLGVLLTAPFVPRLVRSLSPVSYVRWSLLVACGGMLLFPLFPHVWAWIALDFVLGAVICGYFVLSDSLLSAAAEESYRGRLIALYMMAESAGAIGGPLLLSRVGFEGSLPFLIAAVIMLVGIAPWCRLAAPSAPDLGQRPPASYRVLFRAAPLVLIAGLAGAYFDDVPASLLPVFLLESGFDERTAVLVLAVLAAGTVAFQLPAGWLADRIDRRTFLAGLGVTTAGFSLLLLAFVTKAAVLWPCTLVLGGLYNAFDLVALALLGERARLQDLAAMSAALTMAGSIASFVGPPGVGWLMDVAGSGALLAATATVALLIAGAALVGRLSDGSR